MSLIKLRPGLYVESDSIEAIEAWPTNVLVKTKDGGHYKIETRDAMALCETLAEDVSDCELVERMKSITAPSGCHGG